MSSGDESIVNEFTLDEIDLDKPLVDLHKIVDDHSTLINALFDNLNKNELCKIFYGSESEEKDDQLDIERLKVSCLEQLKNVPKKRLIKLLNLELDGREVDLNWEEQEETDEKEIQKKVSPDDLQMNVDDEEYEEFLNSEFNNNEELAKKEASLIDSKSKDSLTKKEQLSLINELAFSTPKKGEILDNCNVDSVQDESVWQNLWNQTHQEIHELKMRADAIKAMMQKSNRSSLGNESDKNADELKTDQNLLDNIESDEYVSEKDESVQKSPSNCSINKKSPIEKISKSSKEISRDRQRDSCSKERFRKELKDTRESKRLKHQRDHRKATNFEIASDDEYSQIKKAMEDEYLEIKVKRPKKLDIERMSVESGEICDDDEEVNLEKLRKAIDIRNQRNRSLSYTSSIDSFGRQRRRLRSESQNRQRSDSNSFCSLDEVLREVELEERKENPSKFESKSSYSNQIRHSKHHHHHHHRSKKPRTPDDERHRRDHRTNY